MFNCLRQFTVSFLRSCFYSSTFLAGAFFAGDFLAVDFLALTVRGLAAFLSIPSDKILLAFFTRFANFYLLSPF